MVFAVAFAGTVAHVASAAAYIILVPLGGLAFRAVGRSPILGIVVAYTAIASGYDASPIPTPNDAIFAGITTAAAKIVDPDAYVSPLSNWFFNIASSLVLAAGDHAGDEVRAEQAARPRRRPGRRPGGHRRAAAVSAAERSGVAPGARSRSLVALVAIVAVVMPHDPRRCAARAAASSSPRSWTGSPRWSPCCSAWSASSYGVARPARSRKAGDVPKLMAEGIKQMAPVLVLFFAIAQFLAYFDWSHIGDVLVGGVGARRCGDRGAPTWSIFLLHPGAADAGQHHGHQRLGDVVADGAGPGPDDDAR